MIDRSSLPVLEELLGEGSPAFLGQRRIIVRMFFLSVSRELLILFSGSRVKLWLAESIVERAMYMP